MNSSKQFFYTWNSFLIIYLHLSISEASKKKEMERQKALAAAKLAVLKKKRGIKSDEVIETELQNADDTEKVVILIKKMQDEELEFARKVIEEGDYKKIDKSEGFRIV